MTSPHRVIGITAVAFALWLPVPGIAQTRPSPSLPPVVLLELKHLEETYRVLDVVAEDIWPGWNDYRQVPFLLEYENGLSVLIGHPNPPAGFEVVPEVRLDGRPVLADLRRVTAKPLDGPLSAGGGPIPFGTDREGRSARVVRMSFRKVRPTAESAATTKEPPFSTEDQILIYIHELFHCFQRSHLSGTVYGNLMYNADVNYGVFSELEGLALHKAYMEPDADRARAYVKQFLVARDLKRATSMTAQQRNQESADEFNEGTATSSEVRTLEVLRVKGFTPRLTAAEDPLYHGFARIDTLLGRYPERLLRDAALVESPRSKAYQYGCFEALLCQRLAPGWQQELSRGDQFLDRVLAARVSVSTEDRPSVERSLEETYPFADIQRRVEGFVTARDAAYRAVKGRTGLAYIVDLKATRQFVTGALDTRGAFALGLIHLFPEGVGPIAFDKVAVSRVSVPAETDQLFYLRVVDTETRSRAAPFDVSGTRQRDGTWKSAVVTTPLFTVKAPHIRITQSPGRVKIQVLARVGS